MLELWPACIEHTHHRVGALQQELAPMRELVLSRDTHDLTADLPPLVQASHVLEPVEVDGAPIALFGTLERAADAVGEGLEAGGLARKRRTVVDDADQQVAMGSIDRGHERFSREN